jgi:hypothetical protein
MTLFNTVSSDPEFAAAIAKLCGGRPDQRTLDLLAGWGEAPAVRWDRSSMWRDT